MAIPVLSAYDLPKPGQFPANKVNWQFNPARAVLLIHDMQDYFVSFYGEDNPLIQQVIANIAALRHYCKQQGVPVIYTAQPNHQSAEDRALLNDMWGAGLNNHPAKQRVVSELTPDAEDEVLVKWRYSAFYRSPLRQIMTDKGRDQLVICGIYGHIGCLTTATDAFMQDIQPFMVADAIADFSLDEHLMALKYVATRSGRVIFTEEMVVNGSTANFSKDELKQQLLTLVDESAEDFDENENLINYGLSSVHIMTLATQWRQQGIELNFVDLAKNPSLNNWWKLLEQQLANQTDNSALAGAE
ncbi:MULTISPECIES: isochorismatase family protein [Yersinia]|uniref:isochorismatase family protein n=1 Tax=Yersinia TaxID=629 RepID=UPI000BFD16EC|nr:MULTISPECIES: isochorismatase family protein [Yersinia]ATM86592.1 isochorismatase [Yersinia frederiksenii]MCB5318516.1 isochorismatase family protein [Yersinia massiliensis]